jgi:hypothetical protein
VGREDSGAEHRGRVETRWCSAHEKRDHIRRGVGTPERVARLQVETDRRFMSWLDKLQPWLKLNAAPITCYKPGQFICSLQNFLQH